MVCFSTKLLVCPAARARRPRRHTKQTNMDHTALASRASPRPRWGALSCGLN